MGEIAAARETMLEYVNRLERESMKYAQVECPLWHHFAPGLYARQMFIPKGVVLTGAVHRTEHLCVVSGAIHVTTDEGVVCIEGAQHIFVSKPGSRRAGFTLEDTWWTTVHATTETDLERLVAELTESTAQELLGGAKNAQLTHNKTET